MHIYSFEDGKCLTRKNSLFRQVQSSVFIPNHQSSHFAPFKHSKLIFAIPKQVRLSPPLPPFPPSPLRLSFRLGTEGSV